MKLETLISHSGELLGIALKSAKSTDSLVSEYLHQKKYIGSKERKFISDVVFSTIRILSISAYCLETSLNANISIDDDFDDEGDFIAESSANTWIRAFYQSLIESKRIDLNSFDNIWFKLLICATSTLLQENYLGSSGDIILNHLKNLYGESVNLKDEIIYSICFFVDINYQQGLNVYEGFCSSFTELKDRSEKLKENNYADFSREERDSFALYCSLPNWIIEELIKRYNDSGFVLDFCNSLKEQAPTTIRVNQYQHNKETVKKHLISLSINVKESTLSPAALLLGKRVQLNVDNLFKQGLFEVQDEGSQLVSFALSPDKKSKVLDACAGAGGKTLHIADIQSDTGSILASDTDFLRLKELRRRAGKHNYQSIETHFAKNGTLPESLKETFDYVLIDAPCSGLGTVRRLPLTKWKATQGLLEKHSMKQLKLLEYYSKFLKSGGILVYSTCSFMPVENDNVIEKFLNKHPEFSADSLIEPLSSHGIHIDKITREAFKITLLPSIYNCDGFFMARLKKDEL